MKSITIKYKRCAQITELFGEDTMMNELYSNICNARCKGLDILRIETASESRFIDPTEIMDCHLTVIRS
jgi:hypothetical protein